MFYNNAGEVVGWGADTQNAVNLAGGFKPGIIKVRFSCSSDMTVLDPCELTFYYRLNYLNYIYKALAHILTTHANIRFLLIRQLWR